MNRKIINVASVPQRSPFRYPGGKTWLVPYIRLWLLSYRRRIDEFIEPFAGGAIVGLTVAFEGLADRVTLVELDPDVSAVWRTILNGQADWLADKILSFKPTAVSVRSVLNGKGAKLRDRAFATVVRNRVQRGGILAPGAGLMNKGENGKGIASRWYPQTLAERIRAIASIRERIRFVPGDGLRYMERTAKRRNLVYFVDPPYMTAGRRLYRYSQLNHERLFQVAKRLTGDFLITYEDTAEIRGLAIRFGLDFQTIPMKNTHNEEKVELLIGRELEWLSQSESPAASPEFCAQSRPRLKAAHP